ncbi:MAG: OmpA family protein [Alphaproteobacteria bacterium]
MTGNQQHRAHGAHYHGLGGVAALLATLVIVGACTWMPDAVNPVEWYKGAKGWVSGDETDKEAAAKPMPGADKPFPKLSSVPQRPSAESRRRTAEERERMAQSLVADRDKARYTDEILRQGAIDATKPPPAPARVTPPAQVTPRQAIVAPAPPRRTVAPPPARKIARAPAPPPPMPAATATPARRNAAPQFSALSFGAPPADVVASLGGGPRASAFPVRPGAPAIASAQPIPGAGFGAGSPVTIRFGVGSARLGPKGRREVRKVYRAYRSRGGMLRVVGHASSRTRDLDLVRHQMVNFNVSLDRANAVARELIRLGVKSTSISVDAASDSQPIFFEVMPAGEAGNRRAEIHLER